MKMIYLIIVKGAKANSAQGKNFSALRYEQPLTETDGIFTYAGIKGMIPSHFGHSSRSIAFTMISV
jgi:hypothetical protein